MATAKKKGVIAQALDKLTGAPEADAPAPVPVDPVSVDSTPPADVDADDVLAAAASIERLAQQYQHMVRAAGVLRDIGALANAKRELEARVLALRAEVGVHEQTVVAAAQRAREAEVEAQQIRDQALADAQASRATAAQQADEVIAEARRQADAIAAQASENAQRIAETAQARLAELNRQADRQAADINDMQQQLEAKRAELADLEGRVNKARAAAQAIIGVQA